MVGWWVVRLTLTDHLKMDGLTDGVEVRELVADLAPGHGRSKDLVHAPDLSPVDPVRLQTDAGQVDAGVATVQVLQQTFIVLGIVHI